MQMYFNYLDDVQLSDGVSGESTIEHYKEFEREDQIISSGMEQFFGPKPDTFKPIPYAEINVGSQMRTFFDAEEQENLSTSIRTTGLQNPLIVFEMSEELKDWYVNLTNEVWGADVDSNTFTPTEQGTYFVLVAGERRYRAIGSIVESRRYDPDAVTVTCQVRSCTSLQDMMGSQVAENMYYAPRPFQYATIIREVYRLGREAGLHKTEEEFIRDHSPAGRTATKNALLFHKMPAFVRDYVAQDKLGYGHSIILHAYYDAYRQKLGAMDIPEDEKSKLLQTRLESRILKVIAEGWTKSKLESVIPGWISELDFEQPELFEAEFHDSSRDQLHTEWKKIRDNHRELINSTGRALGRHIEAVMLLNQVDDKMASAIQPNIRKQLVNARESYRQLASMHHSKRVGVLAAECALEIERLLDD